MEGIDKAGFNSLLEVMNIGIQYLVSLLFEGRCRVRDIDTLLL